METVNVSILRYTELMKRFCPELSDEEWKLL
jgi:hypothetical protein